MDPVSILTIIDLSAKVLLKCYRLQSQMKDAKHDIAQIINEVESVSDVLADLHEAISQEHDWKASTFSVISGPLAATLRVLQELDEKLAPMTGGRLKTSILWPFSSKTVQARVQILQQAKSTLSLALSSSQTSMLLQQGEKLSTIELSQTQKELGEVLKWYKSCDPETNHRLSNERREPNTATWVFDTPTFKEWLSAADGTILWLHGIPGAGKTILCSSIIERLRTSYQAREDYAVLYFYFDFSDGAKQSVASMVKSLIYQLVSSSTSGPPDSAMELYTKCNAGADAPTVDELIGTFTSLLESSRRIFLCVDALDECAASDWSQFFHFLRCCVLGGNLDIAITSRKEAGIERELTEQAKFIVPIESAIVDADVRKYTQNIISRDAILSKWRPNVRQEIIDAIVDGSQGM